MKANIKVNKLNFSVEQFMGGQFAIVNNTNQKIVFGGDSANEDDYNEDYINEVFSNWNGELNSDYKIEA